MLHPILQAALRAVQPTQAVLRHLKRDGDWLVVEKKHYNLTAYRRVVVLGAGKASPAMAQAIEQLLPDLPLRGLIVTKDGHTLPLQRISQATAAHPLPDFRSQQAASQLLAWADACTAQDLVIFLLSGGASALLSAPPAGISLADLQTTQQTLLNSGLAITEVNAVRKHLSRVAGGQLAARLFPAETLCLTLSDVVGNALDVIASGPLVADSSTFASAKQVLITAQCWQSLPPAVQAHLQAGCDGQFPETLKTGHPALQNVQTQIVGDCVQARLAAGGKARELGYRVRDVSQPLVGEARVVGAGLVQAGLAVAFESAPTCWLYSGETTVTVRGNGLGGRNQELALAAALEMSALRGQNPAITTMRVTAFATDGGDGPTDAAGALATADSVRIGQIRGLSALQHLAENNAYPFWQAVGGLIHSGPTGTNVNDLVVVTAGENKLGQSVT
jgi:hydroxypyruvate reductase